MNGSDRASNQSEVDWSFDLHRFIISQLGDPELKPLHSATVTVLYAVIFVTGLVGNVSTCLVILKTPYLRTAPNCYVFSLALSDILTLLIGLPVELFMVWNGSYPWALGDGFCIFRVFALELTSCASILTVLVFTLERFNAVCFPMHTRAQQDVPHSIVKLTIIWLISGICGIPFAYFTRTFRLEHPITKEPIEGTLLCNIPRSAHGYERLILFQISTFLFFLMPLITIIIMYSMIVVAVRRSLRSVDSEIDSWHEYPLALRSTIYGLSNAPIQDDVQLLSGQPPKDASERERRPLSTAVYVDVRQREAECNTATSTPIASNKEAVRRRKNDNQHVSRRTVMRILTNGTVHTSGNDGVDGYSKFNGQRFMHLCVLVAVVCAFFVCWFPYHLQRLLSVYYSEDSNFLGQMLTVLWYISGVLYFASGSVNVVIYHFMSKKYRLALRAMFLSCYRPTQSSVRKLSDKPKEKKHKEKAVAGYSMAVGRYNRQPSNQNINHIKTTYVQVVSVVHSGSPQLATKYVKQKLQIADGPTSSQTTATA